MCVASCHTSIVASPTVTMETTSKKTSLLLTTLYFSWALRCLFRARPPYLLLQVQENSRCDIRGESHSKWCMIPHFSSCRNNKLSWVVTQTHPHRELTADALPVLKICFICNILWASHKAIHSTCSYFLNVPFIILYLISVTHIQFSTSMPFSCPSHWRTDLPVLCCSAHLCRNIAAPPKDQCRNYKTGT